MNDEQPFLTVDDFNDIASLDEVMECTKLNRNSVADCVFAVGLRFIELPEKQTIVDVFEAAGFIKSKGQFKKNPTQLRVNGKKVNPNDPWNFGITAVLCFGKHRNEAAVIWFRKCTENADGSVRKI